MKTSLPMLVLRERTFSLAKLLLNLFYIQVYTKKFHPGKLYLIL